MNKYNYPELLRSGTVVGPVTEEIRDMCQAKVRQANKLGGLPEDQGMEFWPDFLPVVRIELNDRQSTTDASCNN